MSVRIRLRRMGAKKKPFYRIVVADSRTARGGRFIDQLGYYDPTTEPPIMKLDEEKAKMWLGRGAQPSDTTRGLLKKAGVIASNKPVEAKPEEKVEEAPKKRQRKTTASAEKPEVKAEVKAEAKAVKTKKAVEKPEEAEPVVAEVGQDETQPPAETE